MNMNMDDIFSSFFGSKEFSNFHQSNENLNLDIYLDLKISFKEAYCGTTKSFRYKLNKVCKTCGGSGRDNASKLVKCVYCKGQGYTQTVRQTLFGKPSVVNVKCSHCDGRKMVHESQCKNCNGTGRTEHLETITNLKIPAGAYSGMKLRIKNAGNCSKSGEQGNVYIRIVAEDRNENFIRHNFDLTTVMSLTYYDLICGSKQSIELPDGTIKQFLIPENSNSGTSIKLKNCGFKIINEVNKGDLIISLNLKPVGKLTEKQKQLLKEFNETLK